MKQQTIPTKHPGEALITTKVSKTASEDVWHHKLPVTNTPESLELTKTDFKERHIAERTVCFINQEIPFLKKLVSTKKILIFLIVAHGHCQTPTASGPDYQQFTHYVTLTFEYCF